MPDYIVHERNRALVAATAKTLIQIVAPSTRELEVVEFSVSFDGITASDAPVDVDLLRQTDAGTMSSFTPLEWNQNGPAALSSAQTNATVEPAAGDILHSYQVTPNGGLLLVQFARGSGPIVDESGRIGLRVNAPTSAVNATAFIRFRE